MAIRTLRRYPRRPIIYRPRPEVAAGGPPVFGSIGTLHAANTSTPAFAVPANVAAGDIIVVAFFADVSTTTISAFPSGFAAAENSPRTVNAGGVANHVLHVAWKRATGADSGTYSFTLSAAVFVYGNAVRYTNCVASGNPWDTPTAAGDGGNTASTTTPDIAVDTAGPDRLLFFAGTNWSGDAGTWTAPTGFTQRQGGASTTNCEISDKTQTSQGNSGNTHATTTASDRVGDWLGALIGTTTGGGNNWTVTQTDSVGLTDGFILDQSYVKTDDAGLADTAAFDQSYVKTDSAGLTDNATEELLKLVAATDSAGLTDTVAIEQDKVVTDSAGLTDSTALAQSKVFTDSAGLTDTSVLELAKLVSATDDSGLTDSVLLQRGLIPTDSAGLTDTTALTQSKVATDSAGLTDSATQQLVKDVTATDSAGLTDTRIYSRTAVYSDDSGLTDGLLLNQGHLYTDSAGLTDTFTTELALFYIPALVSVDSSSSAGSLDGSTLAGSLDMATTTSGTVE